MDSGPAPNGASRNDECWRTTRITVTARWVERSDTHHVSVLRCDTTDCHRKAGDVATTSGDRSPLFATAILTITRPPIVNRPGSRSAILRCIRNIHARIAF